MSCSTLSTVNLRQSNVSSLETRRANETLPARKLPTTWTSAFDLSPIGSDLKLQTPVFTESLATLQPASALFGGMTQSAGIVHSRGSTCTSSIHAASWFDV